MKITTSFLHLEHTQALDEKINESSLRLKKYFNDKGVMKWSCYVKNGQHFAEVYYHAPHCEYHAKAFSDNLYHSIDLAVEKIEKQIHKRKNKRNRLHRGQTEIIILDTESAWTDMAYDEDEDVA